MVVQVLSRVPPASLPLLFKSKHATLLRCTKLLPPSSHGHAVQALFLPAATRTPRRLDFAEREPQPMLPLRGNAAPPSKWSGSEKAAVISAVAGLPRPKPHTEVTMDAW